MNDPLLWRLVYPDDHVEDEPLTNASIRMSRPGAVVLLACVPEKGPGGQDYRRPIFRVNLFNEDEADGRLYKPVWYRKRSMAMNAQMSGSRLEVTVMGRCREGDNTWDGTLWASLDGLTFGDCPSWAEDPIAVENLMLSY